MSTTLNLTQAMQQLHRIVEYFEEEFLVKKN